MKKIIFFIMLLCFLLPTAYFAYSFNSVPERKTQNMANFKKPAKDKVFIIKSKSPLTKKMTLPSISKLQFALQMSRF